MKTSRAEMLKRFVREAALQLGVEPTDGRARRTGLLMLTREVIADAMAAQLVAGKNVDPTAYLKIEESIRSLLPPEPVAKHELIIEVVGRDGKPISELPVARPRTDIAPPINPGTDPPTAATPTSEVERQSATPSDNVVVPVPEPEPDPSPTNNWGHSYLINNSGGGRHSDCPNPNYGPNGRSRY